ncbi:biotin/lipoyl-containing protein [Desulfurispora thermophila]|uniref:biotin/lipoyl-containing protein n=1 Tax=Desulfurispora thermophila TaxID=265470 RepID=UPI00036CF079|nr:biotin/lipoyl-containing protein [Desulfurispora thermophila]
MGKFKVTVNGEVFEVVVEEIGSAPVAPAYIPAAPKPPVAPPPVVTTAQPSIQTAAPTPTPAAPAGAGVVTAPMPGNINAVKVNVGDTVKAGDGLVILEAMKMENEITAPIDGTVKEVKVQKGQTVNNGDVLVVIG